jgi:lysophospholipase L1-like esterase
MGFPGVTVRFAYRGPAPTVLLGASNDNTAFNVSVNGGAPLVAALKKGSNELPLASGAAPDTGWVVGLMRRNESWQGTNTFHGLRLPPGCELLTPPAPPTRKLLFIGDSITCGESVDRVPPALANGPLTSNAGHSFGMLLGQTFKAQVQLVSCGGRGLTRNWKGQTEDVTAPQFFHRALPDDPAAAWEHSRYVPDAVIIGLGTNDLSSGIPDQAAFISAYEAFLADIRKAYPGTALVITESPIFSETPGNSDWAKRDFLRRCLDAILAKHQAMGDLKLAVAPLHQYQGSAGNAHPVALQHEKIAAELAPVIRSVTGW